MPALLAAGQQVYPSVKIELNAEEQKYVCRAGLKLEKALAHFNVNLEGKVRTWHGLLGLRGPKQPPISARLQPVLH